MESVPLDKVTEAEFRKLNARLGISTAKALNCFNGYAKTGEGGVLAWGCSYNMNDLIDRYEFNRDKQAVAAFIELADKIVGAYNTTEVDAYRGRVVGGWMSKRYSDGNPTVWAVHTGMIAHPLARFAALVRTRKDVALEEAAGRYLATAVAAYREMEPEWAEGAYRNHTTGLNRVKGSPLPANMQGAMGLLAHYLDLAGAPGPYAARAAQVYRNIDATMQTRFSDGKQVLVWSYDYVSGPEDLSHAILTMNFITRAYERKVMPADRFQFVLASFLHEGVGSNTNTTATVDGSGIGINFKATCARALSIYRYSAPTFRRCESEPQ
jgi:hypothetical protein